MPVFAEAGGDRRSAPLIIKDAHRVAQYGPINVIGDAERIRANFPGRIIEVIGSWFFEPREIGMPDAVAGQLADLTVVPWLDHASKQLRRPPARCGPRSAGRADTNRWHSGP